jgi:hypothetical protein
MGLQSVDRPELVRGFIGPTGGEEPQPGADLVAGPQWLEVFAHPGLVGNDGGVFGVRLAFAAVELGGEVDDPAGDVEEGLVVADEQGDQQRRSPMGQVGRPDDLVPVLESQDGSDATSIWSGTSSGGLDPVTGLPGNLTRNVHRRQVSPRLGM